MASAATTAPKIPVSLNPTFTFDGSSSDLAQQLYRQYTKNETVRALVIDESTLPERIRARLNKTGASFAALPGILQRALVWDSGFVLDVKDNLVPVKTLGGRSMADIAVSASEYAGPAGCVADKCPTPSGGVTLRSKFCNGKQMVRVTKCMAEGVVNPSVHSPMWALGVDPDLTPEIKIWDHTWVDGGVYYSVYAIHTEKGVVSYDGCPKTGYDAFVIPCSVTNATDDATRTEMTDPQMSAWVDTVIAAFPKTVDKSLSTPSPSPSLDYRKDPRPASVGLIVGVSLGALLLFGFVFVIARAYCCASGRGSKRQEGGIDPNPLLTSTTNQDGSSGTSRAGAGTPGNNQRGSMGRHSEDFRSSSSDAVLRVLLTDPSLVDRRLVFEQLVFKKMLSKGGYGEVWKCTYEGEDVAVKRLLPAKSQVFDKVRDFASEIQLSASLQHPNVVGFVGVAWTSLENLVMAIEFLPRGDLQSYLKQNGELLSWARDKVHIALGIARALEYLHSRSPPLIHRDLKSKNVLLTYRLDAKLIDFGVSRSFQLEEMTAGVGTPYWTAPEVLESTSYSERSDIYSFGVVLSEIDTCALPYSNSTGASGEKLKPFQILNSVMGGTLQPSFTPSCPLRVREMAAACLARDPAMRPSASELVAMLEQF